MSVVSAIWRVCVLRVLIQVFGATIPVFGAIYFLDYLSRTVFYRVMLHHEQNLLEKGNTA